MDVPAVRTSDLPEDWPARLEAPRDLGTEWLKKGESVLLQVPSAIVPETVNFLFNPSHNQATKFRIAEVFTYPFDLRLKT